MIRQVIYFVVCFRMHNSEDDQKSSCCTKWIKETFQSINNAWVGWKIYFNHPVCSAGLALASLFMTVLGVDNITYGYCMAQCIRKSILGGLLGLTAIVGIIGSLTFPGLRKRFGLHKTGLIGFTSLIAMLTLCVISIKLEGSPFKPFYYKTRAMKNSSPEPFIQDTSTIQPNVSSLIAYNDTNSMATENENCNVSSFLSVSVFLSGIILARFGLWISDLTVTQTLQVKTNIFLQIWLNYCITFQLK